MVKPVTRVTVKVRAPDSIAPGDISPSLPVTIDSNPNIGIASGILPTNPASFSKIDISGLENTPILACEKRNPGYLCNYTQRVDEKATTSRTGIVAYKPTEICSVQNFPVYQNTQLLNRQFRKSYPIVLYVFLTVGITGITTVLLIFAGLLFEGILLGLIMSFITIFIHAFASNALLKRNQMVYKATPMQVNSCYANIQLYNKILAVNKKDHTGNMIDPDTLVVQNYATPNPNDRAVMSVLGKWPYKESGELNTYISAYKQILLDPKIEKL